jgi:hypothetical protein
LTLNFFFNPPPYTRVLPSNTDELAATLRLGTGGTVGLAVLTTAITCQQSRTFYWMYKMPTSYTKNTEVSIVIKTLGQLMRKSCVYIILHHRQ